LSHREAAEPLEPSGEEGVRQITALLGKKPFVTNVNVQNRGQLPAIREGAVVETLARFDRDGVTPVKPPALPAALESHVRHVAEVQRLTLEAARARSRDLALQALLMDPLVRIPTDRAAEMLDKMLSYAKDWLPGWKL